MNYQSVLLLWESALSEGVRKIGVDSSSSAISTPQYHLPHYSQGPGNCVSGNRNE